MEDMSGPGSDKSLSNSQKPYLKFLEQRLKEPEQTKAVPEKKKEGKYSSLIKNGIPN